MQKNELCVVKYFVFNYFRFVCVHLHGQKRTALHRSEAPATYGIVHVRTHAIDPHVLTTANRVDAVVLDVCEIATRQISAPRWSK